MSRSRGHAPGFAVVGFASIFEWTLHGDHRTVPLPPEAHWPARLRFAGGISVYLISFVVSLFNAYVAFALIALAAVYYIVERTPTSPATEGL